jgi:hypothetical protein
MGPNLNNISTQGGKIEAKKEIGGKFKLAGDLNWREI